MKKYLGVSTLLLSTALFVGCSQSKLEKAEDLEALKSDKILLGQTLFFDKALSKNRTQSCSTCHNPESGFADNRDNGVDGMASLGDDGKSLGDRNAPTAAYAMISPLFHYNKKDEKFVGGQFWDGRESSLKGQAGGPPLNPIEMGMPSKEFFVKRVAENPFYVTTLKKVYGDDIFSDSNKAYSAVAESIAEFEKTKEFAPFDSKYDRYLKGEYDLTPLEDLGRSLFFSNNNTNCSTCHMLKGEDKEGETFTNYEYHNIGIPTNIALREKNGVAVDTKDIGLLANPNVDSKDEEGKFKVPTLRNVAVTGPYMHNGIFKDLETVVLFYDKYNNSERVINPESGKKWADAEISHSVNLKDLKAKKLTDRKVQALVAFLKTLTDKRYEHLLEEK